MFILGIETTGFNCSVAILEAGETDNILEIHSDERLNHLKELADLINRVLNEKDITIKDIDAIAVSVGPGSFTGIRIGISTARAISQVLGIKCVAVDSMMALATQMREEFLKNNEIDERKTIFCPIIDGRQNQVYTAIYKDNVCSEAMVLNIDEFVEKLTMEAQDIDKVIVCGDALLKYEEKLNGLFERLEANKVHIYNLQTLQNAKSVAKLGKLSAEKGEYLLYDQLLPNYMRKPEAQRKLEDRLK